MSEAYAAIAPSEHAEAVFGTRFQLFAQAPHVSGYSKPETVWISTRPDQLLPGPADHRMYVRDPIFDKDPYEFPYLPPFEGEVYPPAVAGFDGHFDHLDHRSRQFLATHAFGSVSRVLDIWESYLGRPIVWHFADTYDRLEILPNVEWDNAQSGYGYLELGHEASLEGKKHPYALNFDVIAHEVGHSILFSLLGVPTSGISAQDYFPFHESSADLISLLSFLHFDAGIDRLLKRCRGNLLVLNELNRIAELSADSQIRLASNSRRMGEVTADVHDRSRPFTGAIFDSLVEAYHVKLVEQGLADERLLRVDIREMEESLLQRVSLLTSEAYRAHPFLLKSQLTVARDEIARVLAGLWSSLQADDLTFKAAAEMLIERCGNNFAVARSLEENFRWRGIL